MCVQQMQRKRTKHGGVGPHGGRVGDNSVAALLLPERWRAQTSTSLASICTLDPAPLRSSYAADSASETRAHKARGMPCSLQPLLAGGTRRGRREGEVEGGPARSARRRCLARLTSRVAAKNATARERCHTVNLANAINIHPGGLSRGGGNTTQKTQPRTLPDQRAEAC
ncbi:unnamed protein product [Prorocentrum cordatum]|uniref:Uncharacterized protein n=1 Tax=Prorocentrum cordatum TaxID=2364126 RepID=A0ABN9UZV4_9DINO|nr:unnamed protein product [Polarella glacialis]